MSPPWRNPTSRNPGDLGCIHRRRSGISGYRVFRDGGATAVATVQTTSYTDTNLTANTSYSYTVEAVDNAPTPNVSAASSCGQRDDAARRRLRRR